MEEGWRGQDECKKGINYHEMLKTIYRSSLGWMMVGKVGLGLS